MITQSGDPKYMMIAWISCHRPIGRSPSMPTIDQYCMLPWHQRRSRRMNSGRLVGFSSQLSNSSAITRTSQPAPRICAASTWSWLSTCPPSGPVPRRIGSWQWSTKGPMRMAALWPQ